MSRLAEEPAYFLYRDSGRNWYVAGCQLRAPTATTLLSAEGLDFTDIFAVEQVGSVGTEVTVRVLIQSFFLNLLCQPLLQLLVDNGCLEAFWLGNLKHRDLQGKEVCFISALNALTQL